MSLNILKIIFLLSMNISVSKCEKFQALSIIFYKIQQNS